MRNWLIAWLGEKSTWLGLFTAAAAFGLPHFTEGQEAALTGLAVSFFTMPDRLGK
jgi:hypothetical protein